MLARAVADGIAETLGQPVIVENRAGAGGNVGADVVAKSAPDGYTLLMTSAGILTANQFLYAKMPFDAEKAFVPVSNVADMPMMVVVNPNVAAKTLAELVALARANPGKLNFGSPGIGTTGHLGLALFMHAAGIKLTHIPYKGAAPAITDLIGGQIDGVVDNPPTVLPHIAGRHACARSRSPPNSAWRCCRICRPPPRPAFAGFEASSWFGVVAPAGTPPAIVARLHKEIAAALRQPAVQDRFAKIRRAPARQYAGGVRAADPAGPQDVGRGHPVRRHQGGVAKSRPRRAPRREWRARARRRQVPRKSPINHAMAFDPGLSFEGIRHDIDPEMGLPAFAVPGMAFVLVRFILHLEALGCESLGQLLS